MWRKLTAILLLCLLSSNAFAASRDWQKSPHSFVMGTADSGALTGFIIDSALVYGTSGDSLGTVHVLRETLSNETLKISYYCVGVAGTPTSMTAYIYFEAGSGEDPDRPDTGGTAQYTSDVIDYSSCGTSGWKQHTFTGVSGTIGDTFWFLLANTTATPTSNYPSVMSRGGMDSNFMGAGNSGGSGNLSIENTSGWTADGTNRAILGPMVITYPSGNDYGSPYVATTTPATNTNDRGFRITPTEDITVTSFGSGMLDTNLGTGYIYQGSTLVVTATAADIYIQTRSGAFWIAPTTLTGGLPYDFVFRPAASDNYGLIFTTGNSPSSDVTGAQIPMTYVTGATPGSYTETTTQYYSGWVELGENPAIAGGSTNANQSSSANF